MNVDAFILNEKVCDTGLTRIAPITQPDYRGLRTSNAEIRPDILPSVDMHRTQPASVNSRISLIETANPAQVDPSQPASDVNEVPPLRTNRIGAYLHWSLPQMYRAATSASDNVTKLSTGENISSSPAFRLVPNRWLVIRKMISSEPALTASLQLPSWVVQVALQTMSPSTILPAHPSPIQKLTSANGQPFPPFRCIFQTRPMLHNQRCANEL
jgi:hypothetical protein